MLGCDESGDAKRREVEGVDCIQIRLQTQLRNSLRLQYDLPLKAPISTISVDRLDDESQMPWARHKEVISYLETYCEEEKYALHVKPTPALEGVDVDVFRGILNSVYWEFLESSSEEPFIPRFAHLYIEFLCARIQRLSVTNQRDIAYRVVDYVVMAVNLLRRLGAWNPSVEQLEILQSCSRYLD